MKNPLFHPGLATGLLCAVLAVGLFAACNGDEDNGDEQPETVDWEYPDPYADGADVDWAVETDAVYSRLPAIDPDGGVVVGNWDGELRRLNPDEGDETWRYDASGRIDTAPAIADDGTVYVGDWDGVVHAVDDDGDDVWTHDVGAIVDTSPTIDGQGRIWIADNAGGLHVLSADGDVDQTYELGAAATTSVSIVDGDEWTGWVGTEDDRIHCLDDTGIFETAELDDHPRFDLAVTPDGEAVATMHNGVVAAVDDDCQLQWQQDLSWATVMPAAITEEGDIWAWAHDRTLYLLDADDGETIDQFSHLIRANATTAGTVSDEARVYLGTRGVVSFADDGDSEIRTELDVMDTPIFTDGAAFATTERGAILRLAGDWPALGDSSWPTQHANPARTGRLEQ